MILLMYSSAAEVLKGREVEKVDENLVLSQFLIL